MNKIRILVMSGIVACFTLVGIGGAGAAGGGGESECSDFGDPATVGNVGEGTIRVLAQAQTFSGDLNPGTNLGGDPLVASSCNPQDLP
jgi:hypothetical protein